MPGRVVPGFARRAVLIAQAGIYDLRVHHDDVIMPLVRHWRVFEAEGLDADGERARQDLAAALGALDARAARFVERRAGAQAGLLADPAAASLPLPRAELRFLDLAGGGLGQFTDDLDRSGPHVAGEVLLGERQDVLLRGVLALLELDKGLGPLAPPLIGCGHHRGGGHRRVPADRRLDLDGGDVLAAGDDDVLLPVAQLDVHVGVADGKVTRVVPAARERLPGLPGIRAACAASLTPTRMPARCPGGSHECSVSSTGIQPRSRGHDESERMRTCTPGPGGTKS